MRNGETGFEIEHFFKKKMKCEIDHPRSNSDGICENAYCKFN
jgi:hypothetical protein